MARQNKSHHLSQHNRARHPMPPSRDAGVIPLVTFDQGRYTLDEGALRILAEYKKSVCIIACAGKFRTGKSALLNCLCRCEDGFAVGDTTQACTKGLWLRVQPLEEDETRVVLVVDTEGIDSLGDQSSNEHDVRVFTLALLLSSSFLYNSVGAIDEAQVSTLSLMTKISETVHMRHAGDDESHDGRLADAMPAFYWVLRDFGLRMEARGGGECSVDQYMEEALQSHPSSSVDRNRVREAIREAFPRRQVIPLSRPTQSDSTARLGPHSVSRRFRVQIDDMRHKLLREIVPVAAEGVPLGGAAYVEMARSYVRALNEPDAVPVIRDAWSMAAEVQARDLRDDVVAQVAREVDSLCGKHATPQQLATALAKVVATAVDRFERGALQTSDELVERLRRDLGERTDAAVRQCREALGVRLAAQLHALGDEIERAEGIEAVLRAIDRVDRDTVSAFERDSDAVVRWRADVYGRMRDWILPHAVRATEAIEALRSAENDREALTALAEARATTAEERVARADVRLMQVESRVAQLEAELATALTQKDEADANLADERERSSMLQTRLLSTLQMATESSTGEADDAEDKDDEARDDEGSPTHNEDSVGTVDVARTARLELELHAVRDEASELVAVRETLNRENEGLRRDQARTEKQWEERLREFKERHDEMRERARVDAAEEVAHARDELKNAQQRETELRKTVAETERREARLQASLSALETGYARELRVEKEGTLAARALAEDLQARMVSMHSATLEDLRKRDATARERLQQMLSEKVELQVARAEATGAVERARAEVKDLKRRMSTRDDFDRETKRMRDDLHDERARRESVEHEVTRLRTRCEDAVRVREEALTRAHTSERENASMQRELVLSKAEAA